MTDSFFALYWCRCVNISFTFHNSIILMASLASLFRKHCTCTSVLQETLEMAFPRPSIQKFSGEACSQSPLGQAAFDASTFFPRVRTLSKSHATPVLRLLQLILKGFSNQLCYKLLFNKYKEAQIFRRFSLKCRFQRCLCLLN